MADMECLRLRDFGGAETHRYSAYTLNACRGLQSFHFVVG